MAKVKFNKLNKVYDGDVHAVKDFDLEIQDKQFVVLVGPSGCGKSTTLRMVAGLEEISHGELLIGDTRVNDTPPKDRDIAMVFQNYALYPHMTVYDNMAFGLKLRKFPKEEIDSRVNEAAKILGLDELLKRQPKALSGGQRQRVALGRAIVRKPKVFLFDEPLSNLDAKLRVGMRNEIQRLHTKLQSTMIYVTHDQVEAMTMGDKIVVMNNGLIQQVDDPITLYNHPVNKFVAGFIGTPPMNFFNVQLINEGSDIFATDGKFKLKLLPEMKEVLQEKNYDKKEVVFGIRPEDIFLKTEYADKIDQNNVEALVEVVEPMGSETYLYFTNSENVFIARVESQVRDTAVNQNMEVIFNLYKSKIFDKETEETIVDLKY